MVKELYVADSTERLIKLAELSASIKLKPAIQLARSTKALLKEAEKQRKMGDEEQAFIFYMKYFTLINIIRKAKDFHKIKSEQRDLLGTNEEISRRMDILEQIKKNLLRRYAEKNAKLAKSVKREVEENKENVIVQHVNDKKVPKTIFIASMQLHGLMNVSPDKVLLIDCRPIIDFQASKIMFSNLISIPEEKIKSGMSASVVSREIATESISIWNRRGNMEFVVLIDEDTNEKHTDKTKPIWILRHSLEFYDPEADYQHLLLLDGGFRDFFVTYPMKTTNPRYESKQTLTKSLYPPLHDIEYPDVDGIKMKPTQTAGVPGGYPVPAFDRKNKPALGHKNPTAQPGNTISFALEQEKLYDHVLQKEKEALNVGKEYISTLNATISVGESDQTEHYNKQTELEYKFIQKENELNDTIMEVEPDLQSLDALPSHEQNPEASEVLARIKAKREMHTQNKKELEKIGQKREELAPATKEQQKRHLQMKEEEDELIRPKQPAFDRSAKPTVDRNTMLPQIHRDFSPVYGTYGDVGATGLKNLGNTCYMNSIIQCLVNLEPFCEYLKKDGYLRHINRKSKTHGQLAEELAHLCKELWSGKYKSISPRDFRSIIGREHKMFATYDQQDSHELLVILIDMLHSELQIPMDDTILSDGAPKSEVAWREFVKNSRSIVQSLFFGQIRSTVKCRTCGFESATYEGFSHLSLELPQDNRQYELYDCFDLYFNGEIIEGWTCPQCKQNRDAVKKLDISRLPPVLVIHLKRFYASMDTANTYLKKQNYVRFPISDFKISDYITPSLKQRKIEKSYDLYAVSNHYGTMNRGHYTAFCKNSKSKLWYKFDDNYVTQISSDDVNSSAGYILFYSQL